MPSRFGLQRSLRQGDSELIDAVGTFIASTFGCEPQVFHEVVSDVVHIDLWFVPPASNRPWVTVLTSGMAERPLPTHSKFRGPARVELVLALPADWPMDLASWKQERNYWPMRVLKQVCRYPHECGLPVGIGHTLEAPALDGNQFGFTALLLGPPAVFGDMPASFQFRGERVHYLSLVPIFADELGFARSSGSRSLWELLGSRPLPELIDARTSVLGR